MTEQDFDKLLKQKLENFEADVPNSCWEVVAHSLPTMHKPQRAILWRRMAVAAVLVLAIGLSGFLFLKNEKRNNTIAIAPQNKSIQQKAEPKLEIPKESAPLLSTVTRKERNVSKPTSNKVAEKVLIPKNSETIVHIMEPSNEQKVSENNTMSQSIGSNQTSLPSEDIKIPAKATDKELEAFINAGIEAQKEISNPVELEKNKSNSIALLAGLPSVSHSSSDNEFHPLRSASAFDDAYNILSSASNTAISTPFERRHSIPFSLGLIIGKEVYENLTIETGLHYTYLKSEQLQSEILNEIQKLYYLGLPLSATYRYANLKRFSFYLKAGGMVEKNIAGRWIGEIKEGQTSKIQYTKTDNTLEDRLQWSIHTGAGINYKISGPFYFYLEPSFTYFPDNGSEYQTIRKKQKFELSLQGGLRAIFSIK